MELFTLPHVKCTYEVIDQMVKTTGVKKAASLFFLAFILFSYCLPVSAAPANPDLEMDVRAGYNDTAKLGSDVPFYITLNNKGDDTDGEIQISVNTNPEARVMYAQPVSLPRGSNKEVTMYIPVTTANKKIEVKFARGENSLANRSYEFKKLISPETPVIGILTDDPAGYRDLNGLKITESANSKASVELQRKYAVMAAAGEKVPVLPDRPAELLFLDKNSFPDKDNALNCFTYLIIGNFDTSSLPDAKKEAISNWVSGGRNLILGTGPNWKKVYSGLKTDLHPFDISSSESVPFPKELATFTGKSSATGNLNVAKGNAGSGKVIAGSNSNPLAITYLKGNGTVTVLGFDPALSPISGWEGQQTLWKNLLTEINNASSTASSQSGTGISSRPVSYNYEYLASRVPENQTPPFRMLMILIVVYVIIVGPVIYLFLKWKDKRDLNWIVIPAAAIIFMGIIYFAGFKTRYTSAVLNTVSVINLESGKQAPTINSSLAIFNNTRGNLKLEYGKDLRLDVNMNRYYDGYMSSYQPPDADSGRLISKLTYSDPLSFEMFDVRMWDPRYVSASKPFDAKNGITNSISINSGKVTGTIRNGTDLDLNEAFITIGSNIIELGDMSAGEEKKIEEVLGSSINFKLSDFLDKRYGPPHYIAGQKLPEDWPEKNRKRTIVENIFRNYSMASQGQPKIYFFAFNNDFDPSYNITVNGKDPKTYNTNAVMSQMNMVLEKGKPAVFPSGLIKAVMEQDSQRNAFIDGDTFSGGGVRVNTSGDVQFKIALPGSLSVDKLKISWSPVVPSYIKYQPKSSTQQYGKNEYKYYIYDVKKSKASGVDVWEEIKEEYEVTSAISSYVNDSGEIKLKANVTVDRTRPTEELLGIPEIEISGVVK